jgi:hypothetical protein
VAALDIESIDMFLPEQRTRSTGLTAMVAAETLKALNVSQTAIFAHSEADLHAFVAAANKVDICVTWEDVLLDR